MECKRNGCTNKGDYPLRKYEGFCSVCCKCGYDYDQENKSLQAKLNLAVQGIRKIAMIDLEERTYIKAEIVEMAGKIMADVKEVE